MYGKATINNCEKIYAMICDMECKQLPFDKFYKIYQQQINHKQYYCIVCECNDVVVSVLNLRFEQQLHHCECIAEIMEFAVDRLYRNKGRGKEMFYNTCQIAKDFGCT